jgi:hypothetical protein
MDDYQPFPAQVVLLGVVVTLGVLWAVLIAAAYLIVNYFV